MGAATSFPFLLRFLEVCDRSKLTSKRITRTGAAGRLFAARPPSRHRQPSSRD
jgi:hypothetical protein